MCFSHLFDGVEVEVSQDGPQQGEDGVGEGAEVLHLDSHTFCKNMFFELI